jgi:hypothetical protein
VKSLLFVVAACGGTPAAKPVANHKAAPPEPAPAQTLEPDRNEEFRSALAAVDKHEGKPWTPECSKVIRHWLGHAFIDTTHEPQYVDSCRQDLWSREARVCFSWVHSMAPAAVPTSADQCIAMLDKRQQANLHKLIQALGDTALLDE